MVRPRKMRTPLWRRARQRQMENVLDAFQTSFQEAVRNRIALRFVQDFRLPNSIRTRLLREHALIRRRFLPGDVDLLK